MYESHICLSPDFLPLLSKSQPQVTVMNAPTMSQPSQQPPPPSEQEVEEQQQHRHPNPADPNPDVSSHSYAIELYFDPALENQVLKAWNVLARRQITTHLISISSRPHITLLLNSSPNPNNNNPPFSSLHSALRSFAARSDPIPVSLSSLGTTSGAGNVLFLLPTPTVALLQVHSQLCELVRKEGVEVGEEYRVDAWLPRCSVAEDVPKSRMAEAFCVLRDMKLPVTGYVMDVGVVEFGNGGSGPVREVFSVPLGGSGTAGLLDA